MTEPQIEFGEICAVILAAGMSTRMGAPKMLLPWKGSTVLETILVTLRDAGVRRLRVVVGANRNDIESRVKGQAFPAETVYNPNFANGEMMDSIRVGFLGLEQHVRAVLLVLGDQPQLERDIVVRLIDRYRQRGSSLIVPSYQMRRGHPWLIARPLWDELILMGPGETMRDFLNRHANEIDYINVETNSVLQDLDTPEDYQRALLDSQE